MRHTIITATLFLAACSEANDDQETFGTEASSTTQDAAGSHDENGVGTGSEEADSESSVGDGDGTGDSGDGDSNGDGDSVGETVGDSSSESVSTGDGDGDGGDGDSGTGEMKFPGDPCDPLVDLCVDGYGCDMDDSFNDLDPEFRCWEQVTFPDGDGGYGSNCLHSVHCNAGFKCASWDEFPEDVCLFDGGSAQCCIEMCAYEDICDNGATCSVIRWPADLEDYLDDYTGIGICSTP